MTEFNNLREIDLYKKLSEACGCPLDEVYNMNKTERNQLIQVCGITSEYEEKDNEFTSQSLFAVDDYSRRPFTRGAAQAELERMLNSSVEGSPSSKKSVIVDKLVSSSGSGHSSSIRKKNELSFPHVSDMDVNQNAVDNNDDTSVSDLCIPDFLIDRIIEDDDMKTKFTVSSKYLSMRKSMFSSLRRGTVVETLAQENLPKPYLQQSISNLLATNNNTSYRECLMTVFSRIGKIKAQGLSHTGKLGNNQSWYSVNFKKEEKRRVKKTVQPTINSYLEDLDQKPDEVVSDDSSVHEVSIEEEFDSMDIDDDESWSDSEKKAKRKGVKGKKSTKTKKSKRPNSKAELKFETKKMKLNVEEENALKEASYNGDVYDFSTAE